ncbi:MAG: DUF5110 domain-containing protein [Candidatus Sulfotelmatobacter sp.]
MPLGPEIEYAGEKPDAPIELRIYGGANGSFDLYEDGGDGCAYEKGLYSVIPISWNDKTGMLTIGACTGNFPGMAREREFHMVLVRENHGGGLAQSPRPDREITYRGDAVSVVLR